MNVSMNKLLLLVARECFQVPAEVSNHFELLSYKKGVSWKDVPEGYEIVWQGPPKKDALLDISIRKIFSHKYCIVREAKTPFPRKILSCGLKVITGDNFISFSAAQLIMITDSCLDLFAREKIEEEMERELGLKEVILYSDRVYVNGMSFPLKGEVKVFLEKDF